MTPSTIAAEIQTFVAQDILCGQADGLSRTTPLLELGILDSFGLLKLVAHVNQRYDLSIKVEELSGGDFADVDAIAQAVARKLVDTPRPATSPTGVPHDSIIEFEEPDCAQVFLTFIGLGNVNASQFFDLAGLHDRNIVVFRDPYDLSYRRGISSDLPNIASVCRWIADWLAERPHVDEVYCIGASSGGPMAMIAGQQLQARTVWAFGPRPTRGNPTQDTAQRMEQFLERATGKRVRQLLTGVSADDHSRIDAAITSELVDSYYAGLLDPNLILDREHLADIVQALRSGTGVTQHRIYYVAEDPCDAAFVEAVRYCPGVMPIAVPPSDETAPTWAFTPWVPPPRWVYRNHLVIDLLRDRHQLGDVFPPFRAAAPTPEAAEAYTAQAAHGK